MLSQMRLAKQQQKNQPSARGKGVWGSGSSSTSVAAPPTTGRTLSLMEIQMEEEKKMQLQKKLDPPVSLLLGSCFLTCFVLNPNRLFGEAVGEQLSIIMFVPLPLLSLFGRLF